MPRQAALKIRRLPVPDDFWVKGPACLATNEGEAKSMNPYKILSIAREGVNDSLRFVSAVRLS